MSDANHAIQNHFWDNYIPVPECGCWLWTRSLASDGYGQLKFNGKLIRSHRIAWLLSKGNIPKDKCVLHKCDVRPCINPDHLFLGTRTDNQHDMCKKGRGVNLFGQNHGMAKITEKEALEIKYSKKSYSSLASEFGLNKSTIASIKTGKNWKHLCKRVKDDLTEKGE